MLVIVLKYKMEMKNTLGIKTESEAFELVYHYAHGFDSLVLCIATTPEIGC